VHQGALPWNDLAQPMKFAKLSDSNIGYFDGCGNYMDNYIFQRKIDGVGNALAEASWCLYSGTNRMYSFHITFDGGEDWYYGSGDAPPGRPDFISVAAHEFGHVTGFVRHLDDSGDPLRICLDKGAQETMCKVHYFGSERQRTLGEHDAHTFREAY
jgi:hypothetical protein